MPDQPWFPDLHAGWHAAIAALRGRPVTVIGHVRPDGDCIGSQVALTRVLRHLGIDAVARNQHTVPGACQPFVGDTPFASACQAAPADTVTAAVDCADPSRFGEALGPTLGPLLLNIDHHISNTGYALHNLVAADSAATAEILAGLFLDLQLPIDAVTAQALYVGIATDTGQFRFSSTGKRTFAICCHLLEAGADPAQAAFHLYEQESPAKLALLQRFLSSFEFHCGGRVCIGTLDQAVWAATGASKEDTEGLVDYARSMAGVEIGVLLEERSDVLKGSFRAKDPVHRVDRIAARFNGGGHACAAGFNPRMDLPSFRPQLIAALEEHFANYDRARAGAPTSP
jgi:bifunctional oligoribonuclease and PAP phosphatase NrnA